MWIESSLYPVKRRVEITMVSALGLSLAEVFVERREFPRRIVGMQCVQMASFASLGD